MPTGGRIPLQYAGLAVVVVPVVVVLVVVVPVEVVDPVASEVNSDVEEDSLLKVSLSKSAIDENGKTVETFSDDISVVVEEFVS